MKRSDSQEEGFSVTVIVTQNHILRADEMIE